MACLVPNTAHNLIISGGEDERLIEVSLRAEVYFFVAFSAEKGESSV